MVRRMVLCLTAPPIDMRKCPDSPLLYRTTMDFTPNCRSEGMVPCPRVVRSCPVDVRGDARHGVDDRGLLDTSGPRGQPDPGLKSGWSGARSSSCVSRRWPDAASLPASSPILPGISQLMPGEAGGAAVSPVLRYLRALEAFDRQFPGFAQDTHAVEVVDGDLSDLLPEQRAQRRPFLRFIIGARRGTPLYLGIG